MPRSIEEGLWVFLSEFFSLPITSKPASQYLPHRGHGQISLRACDLGPFRDPMYTLLVVVVVYVRNPFDIVCAFS